MPSSDTAICNLIYPIFKDLNLWSKLKTLINSLVESQPCEAAAAVGRVSSAPKVLFVDDDKEFVEALRIRFRPYGVETFVANNGMQGYWTAIRALPDVIITDYTMPQGNGEHMIVRLREFPLTRDIPIFVVTGRRIDGAKDRALQRDMTGRRGVSAFFHKPIEFDRLIEELGRHITFPRRPTKKRNPAKRQPSLPGHQDLAEK